MSLKTLKEAILPPEVFEACLRLKSVNAKPILVGGWVRDRLMGLPSQETSDIDIEVFHIDFEKLQQLFSKESHVAFPKFGVLRLDYVDLSLPRIEHSTGESYNDFYVQIKPDLSFEEAGRRRDFTVNAIGWDPLAKKLLDPFHGIKDIERKLLKPITAAFMEDSYRILRAAQLIARFDFTPDAQLLKLGLQMPYKTLSTKHIQNTKVVLDSAPYKGKALQFLQKIQWQSVVEALKV